MMKKCKKTLTLLIVMIWSLNIFSQDLEAIKGAEFWLAFSWEEHPNDVHYYIFIQTFEEPATVTTSIPFQNWEVTRTIPPHSWAPVKIPIHLVNSSKGGEPLETGIHVVSDVEVSLVAWHRNQYLTDATEILPTDFLGTEYWLISHTGYLTSESTGMIVAIEDETEIEIKSLVPLVGLNGQTPEFTIILNKGETFQLIAQSDDDDLTGTHIISCKPIAVFGNSTGTRVYINQDLGCCSDKIWSQMHPTSAWTADTFFVFPDKYGGTIEPYYRLKITAAESNTWVKFNGEQVFNFSLAKGTVTYVSPYKEDLVITSNKPISIQKIMVSGTCLIDNSIYSNGDPSMTHIMPSSAMISEVTYRPYGAELVFPDNYIDVFMRKSEVATFRFNGQPFNPSLKYFTHNDEFVWFTIDVDPYITYTLSAPDGFLAYAYGRDDADSYSHCLGYKMPKYERPTLEIIAPDTVCINQEFYPTFLGAPELETTQIEWLSGEEITSTDIFPSFLFPQEGVYEISLHITNGDCYHEETSKIITVIGTPTPDFQISGPEFINDFDTFLYTIPALDHSLYNWEVEFGNIISHNNHDSIYVKWENHPSAQLSVQEITIEGCLGSTDNLNLKEIVFESCIEDFLLHPNPVNSFAEMSFIAQEDSNTNIYLFNMAGQKMSQELIPVSRGNNRHLINVDDLAAGVYYLQMKILDCVYTTKFVKMR